MNLSQSSSPGRWHRRPPVLPRRGLLAWLRFGSPWRFYSLARTVLPGCLGAAALFGALGLAAAVWAPGGAQSGSQAWRIAFLQMPLGWIALLLYGSMAVWAAFGRLSRARLAPMLVAAIAPTGALLSGLALVTGVLAGSAGDGGWAWDARTVSHGLLLVLFGTIAALPAAIDDPRRADAVSAAIALLGLASLPLALPANGWPDGVPADARAVAALTALGLAFWAYAWAVTLGRVRLIIVERERRALLEEGA